jgi:hypothetical protein
MDTNQAPWTPFERVAPPALGDPRAEYYLNSRYQVELRRYHSSDGGPALVHLSIKRLDKQPVDDFRDNQRIKNELVGGDREGIELYPAEERLVDTANQYHIWVIDSPTYRFPIGFNERLVSDASIGDAVQRPWPAGERPADCLDEQGLRERLRRDPVARAVFGLADDA